MIPTQTSTAIPMNRHPILCYNAWQTAALSEKEILSWIMAPGKGESAFIYPTRLAAIPSVWNTMNGSFPGQKKTGSMPFQGTGLPLK